MDEALQKMDALVKTLNEAAKAYYSGDGRTELMSDRAYDELLDELAALERETGVIRPESPTRRVGYAVVGALAKVTHEQRMLSLDKTKDVEVLAAFLGDHKGLLSWKLDGLTMVLTYESGRLARAVTRGNGEVGEDVTHNARHFKYVPEHIPFAGKLVLRGEALISFADFESVNASMPAGEKYKNPRNLTSGTVRQLNSAVAAGRGVAFFAFTLVTAEGRAINDSKEAGLLWLSKLGFHVAEYEAVTADNLADAVSRFKSRVGGFGYATDGLVLTMDSIAYSLSLGETSKFPKDSVAFKWADETAETTLLEVKWQTSRTGLINPIAVFEPVELEGTTVSRASVHNLSIIEELALGIGDRLTVYKANMIIPQILDNLTRSGNLPVPKQCPVCGFHTETDTQQESKTLICPNPNCQAQLLKSLKHFASRDAMNITGLSEATLSKLLEKGLLKHYTDIYALSQARSAIAQMDGFGEKSCEKLLAAIEKSKDARCANVLYALGIHHIGLRSAKLLCAHFNDDLAAVSEAAAGDMMNIEGFGGVMAESVSDYFQNGQNLELFHRLLSLLRLKKAEAPANSKPLAGLTFVITGGLTHFENRKALEAQIEALGGKTSSSVSASTSYLINNDTQSPSSKNKKAKELGVPILSEDALIEQVLSNRF